MAIKYTSIYADQQGVSHFRDLEIEVLETILGPLIPPLGASAHQMALETYFLTFPAGISMDWHPAPRRLFHFFLSGSCEVTVSDGSVRTFQQGDIVLAEDTLGKGHITKNPGEGVTLMAVVAVP